MLDGFLNSLLEFRRCHTYGMAWQCVKLCAPCIRCRRNVLLSREGNAKLGDVGFSRIMHHDFLSMSLTGRRLGTFNWAAPEVLLGEPATVQADIYSYGERAC